jgi:DNA-binding YbaB/EbfC family protein
VQPNMKMIQQMQQRLQKVQEDLGNEVVEGSAGGGAVTIAMTGHMRAQSVKIEPAAVDPEEVELLEEMVLSALNDAVQKAQDLAGKRMASVTGGLKIPGLM